MGTGDPPRHDRRNPLWRGQAGLRLPPRPGFGPWVRALALPFMPLPGFPAAPPLSRGGRAGSCALTAAHRKNEQALLHAVAPCGTMASVTEIKPSAY
jgi:hypothetical protein